jgi:probable HAF family extracellular repeat protein
MRLRMSRIVVTLCGIAALAFPAQMFAQESQQEKEKTEHSRYKLKDLGTLGGPNSGTNALSVVMNNAGAVTGFAETIIPDPFPTACFNADCFVSPAFRWHNGVLTDLGSLPGGGSSFTDAINSHDQVVGFSQNGLIDPVAGIPEFVATVWEDGRIINLGTLGGGFSLATMNNNQQQVIGCAFNDIPDPFTTFTTATSGPIFYGIGFEPRQLRAFRWQGKKLQDLGTLGGPDACAAWINERGQITGASFTNAIVNPTTSLPTLDPFLWENGKMLDLGSLGGTIGLANVVNNRGQVAGLSGLAGDQTSHPFIWPGEDGKMQDLGTLGGSFGVANAINDAGEVVGGATTAGDAAIHAFIWKQGKITDLGSVPGYNCIEAFGINSRGQVIGQAETQCMVTAGAFAFLWENGHMIDLNVFVPPGSALQLNEAKFINDAGMITGAAFLPDGDQHAFALIPCEADDDEGCVDGDEAATTAAPRSTVPLVPAQTAAAQASLTPSEMKDRIRTLLTNRNRRFGVLPPK